MKKDFIPRSNTELNNLIINFIERLDKHSRSLKLESSDIPEAKKILKKHLESYSEMISLRAKSKSSVENFKSNKKNSINLIRRLSKNIKSDISYNTAIGEDFGIINHYKPERNFTKHQPELKATISGNYVKIKYLKNDAKGLIIYSKRGSENKFTQLAITVRTTYIDKRPKLSGSDPEKREYYAFYLVNDEPAGKRSNVIKAIVP